MTNPTTDRKAQTLAAQIGTPLSPTGLSNLITLIADQIPIQIYNNTINARKEAGHLTADEAKDCLQTFCEWRASPPDTRGIPPMTIGYLGYTFEIEPLTSAMRDAAAKATTPERRKAVVADIEKRYNPEDIGNSFAVQDFPYE